MNSFKLYWIFGVVLLSCTDMNMDDEIPPLSFRLAWEMGVQPLIMDGNGYLHMTINPSSWQTIKTLYGYVTRVGSEEGVNVIKFGWASSHYWVLGDTLGYIIDVGLDDGFQYVYYDTTYIVGFSGHEVPCVNSASYSREDGLVNTVIAPVKTMQGDTIMVYWGMHDNWRLEEIYGEFQIILD